MLESVSEFYGSYLGFSIFSDLKVEQLDELLFFYVLLFNSNNNLTNWLILAFMTQN